MKLIYRIVIFMLLIARPGGNGQAANGNAQAQVETIAEALDQNKVGKIEILEIPSRVLTRSRITPSLLETQYYNKLTMARLNSNLYRDALIRSFDTLSVSPRGQMADLRWGVVFFSTDGTRLGAVYFDGAGRFGAINETPVAFGGQFFDWLSTTFSACFQ
jgi:hypothetical protein